MFVEVLYSKIVLNDFVYYFVVMIEIYMYVFFFSVFNVY